jgi:murein DD-endopeptidase MepM/ murein hydrolase activator NlpD
MNSLTGWFRSSPWPLAIALALVSIGAAGCSAESTRFGETPYAARGGPGEATGSIPSGQGAPVDRVETRPLQTSQLPPAQSPAPVASTVVGGGGRGMASYSPPVPPYNVAPYNPPAAPATYNPPPSPAAYNPPPSPAAYNPATYSPPPYNPAPGPEFTGSVAPPPSVLRKPTSAGQWSWDGGIAVTVAPGETVESISRRHGVPVAVIMEANKLASPNAIQAGQRLVIPRYSSPAVATAPQPSRLTAPAAPRPVPPVTASAAPRAAGPINSGVHVVAPGETLTKIAHLYGKSLAEIAKANNILPYSKLSIGDRIIIPGARVGSTTTEAEPTAAPPAPPKASSNKAVASAAPAQSASMVTPAANNTGSADTAVKAATETAPGFRWPVRGRIIAGFGPKPNGQQNDGIDVAVPENTPIKAAEDGVVAYAGSELKGYGNLVLVRHPNGYVTAYAHAKELLVKRGDQIKRGDVIAKSGQSGNVDAPQLHFEVRKGSAPVDPMQFLNGA